MMLALLVMFAASAKTETSFNANPCNTAILPSDVNPVKEKKTRYYKFTTAIYEDGYTCWYEVQWQYCPSSPWEFCVVNMRKLWRPCLAGRIGDYYWQQDKVSLGSPEEQALEYLKHTYGNGGAEPEPADPR